MVNKDRKTFFPGACEWKNVHRKHPKEDLRNKKESTAVVHRLSFSHRQDIYSFCFQVFFFFDIFYSAILTLQHFILDTLHSFVLKTSHKIKLRAQVTAVPCLGICQRELMIVKLDQRKKNQSERIYPSLPEGNPEGMLPFGTRILLYYFCIYRKCATGNDVIINIGFHTQVYL